MPVVEYLSGEKLDSKTIVCITHRAIWVPSGFYEVKERGENSDWNESKDKRKEDEEESRREMRRHFQFFA